MFLELCLAVFLGLVCGIVTGLLPGLHVNLLAQIVVSLCFSFSFSFSSQIPLVFLVALALSNSFFSFLPPLFIGTAQSDTALVLLPAQQMMQEGLFQDAVFLSALGSVLGLVFALLCTPLLLLFLESAYSFFKVILVFVLFAVVIFLILSEKGWNEKFWAFLLVLLVCSLGLLVLDSPLFANPLLLLFSGLFGVSSLLYSFFLGSLSFPEQKKKRQVSLSLKEIFLGVGVGGLSAVLCSVSPGLGSSQAGLLFSGFFRKSGKAVSVLSLSAITTIDFVVSIATFFVLGRARNGAVVGMQNLVFELDSQTFLLLLSVAAVVGFLCYLLMPVLASFLLKFFQCISLKILFLCLLCFLLFLVFYFEGFFGILACLCATSLGLLCLLLGVRRVHLCSVLVLPFALSLL